MRDAIGASRLDLDEIQSYRHNPTTYVELVGNALYSPYVLHYAPAAERFRHIIERLKRFPELVSQAEANLMDSPEVWNAWRARRTPAMWISSTVPARGLPGAAAQGLRRRGGAGA